MLIQQIDYWETELCKWDIEIFRGEKCKLCLFKQIMVYKLWWDFVDSKLCVGSVFMQTIKFPMMVLERFQ
jgi:hypothetical protein